MKDRALQLLFRRYRERGDGRALAAIFDRTAGELLALACHLVRDPSEAEDLVQATFLTAIQKSARYDGSAPLQAWLYGILWREAAKTRRRAARTPDARRLGERDTPDPLEQAAAGEVPTAVRAALARLPATYREVLEPLLFHEQRAERIAQDLRRSPGTVRSQIHRGLEELRRVLAPRLAAFGAVALPTRGLARLRADVLQAAGVSPATVAAAPAWTLTLALGGVLVSKTLVVGTAALVLMAAGAWLVLERSTPGLRAGAVARAEPARSGAARVETSASPAPVAGARAGGRSAAAPTGAPQPVFADKVAYWLARFGEAPEDWRHGWKVSAEIARLPPEEALAILTAVWPSLSVPVKEQALKPFVFEGGHVHALAVLDLAARDAAPSVQQRAFGYLRSYAFQDFALDYEAYLAWSERNRGRPVGDVLRESARAFVAESLALAPLELGQRLLALQRLDLAAGGPAGVDLAAELRAVGGLRVLETALADPEPDVRALALRWSKALQADEGWLRAWVLPALAQTDGEPELLAASFDALARPDCQWASAAVLAYLERGTRAELPGARSAARALADIGAPASIPRLIELLLQDRTGALAYDIGYFALAPLTGVNWQEGYDGAWWASWWQRNRARFPPEVAALEVGR